MKRIVTSVALAIFALSSIFAAPPVVFALVVAGMAVVCYMEYANIARVSGVDGPLWVGYVAGLVAMSRVDALPLLALGVLTVSLALKELPKALGFAGSVTLGVAYVFLAWRCAFDLRAASPFWLLFALSINWVGDVAAYYVGRAIGRHKLAPRVSPGKSWEGSIASMLGAVAFGYFYAQRTGLVIGPAEMMALSAVSNVAGQVGDLAESALKRGAGVKDSGTLLPGHGGFLDRLDSSLFTLPVVYYWLRWTGVIAGS